MENRLSLEECINLASKIDNWGTYSIGPYDQTYRGKFDSQINVEIDKRSSLISWILFPNYSITVHSNNIVIGCEVGYLFGKKGKKIKSAYKEAVTKHRQKERLLKEEFLIKKLEEANKVRQILQENRNKLEHKTLN